MPEAASTSTEAIVVATLLQLAVIVLAARGANSLARRFGQPGAVGEIVAGLMLGPSFLGAVLPDVSQTIFLGPSAVPLQVISQVGLTLLMFQIGSDFAFGQLAESGAKKAVLIIAAAAILVPLIAGFCLGQATARLLAPGFDPLSYSLFAGVAMAITAVPILGRILREFSLTCTRVGVIAISAAAINDVVCWLILVAVAAFASRRLSAASEAMEILGLVTFGASLWLLGRPAVKTLIRHNPIADGRVPPGLMAIVLALIFISGIITFKLGIFVIFGGFAVGVLFCGHEPFIEAWRHQVGQFVLVFFLPIFFTFTGLRTNILGLATASDWLWCLVFVATGFASKIIPIYAAGRLAGLDRNDAFLCGTLMNTRALMELVVLNVGLDLGVLPRKVFTMLVIMAVASTVATAPLLRFAFRRIGLAMPEAIEA